jgi:hypothetical protein
MIGGRLAMASLLVSLRFSLDEIHSLLGIPHGIKQRRTVE